MKNNFFYVIDFLIAWSCKKTRQKLIDEETNTTEKYHEQCSIKERQKKEIKRLLIEHKEKQQQEMIFEYDKHLFTSYQWDFHIGPHANDDREPSTSYFQEQK